MYELNDAQIVLSYMKDNGFNEHNYQTILEIMSSANESLSQYLPLNNQFLLSKKVKDDELYDLGLCGSYGYLGENGIVIPDIPLVPEISNFEAIIGNGIAHDLAYVSNFGQDKFLGACIDTDDELADNKKNVYNLLTEIINYKGSDEYRLHHDTISEMNKEVLLVSPKQKVKVKVLEYPRTRRHVK